MKSLSPRSARQALLPLALCAALALAACGGHGSSGSEAGQAPAGSLLSLDQKSVAPIEGGSLTLQAKIIAPDGTEVRNASIAWSSSNESVATVTPSPATPASPAGSSATVAAVGAGSANIVASVTLSDGSSAQSVTAVTVKAKDSGGPGNPGDPGGGVPPAPGPAKTYTLNASPSSLTLAPGGAAQGVSIVVGRSDGADGFADLGAWSWTVSDAANFTVTPGADNHSATVSTANVGPAASGTLTACASTPAGDQLCSNVTLARPAKPLPAIAFDLPQAVVKPGRDTVVSLTLTDTAGEPGLSSQASISWSLDSGAAVGASISGSSTGSSVTVAGNTYYPGGYSGNLLLTVSYPDGRSNSASIPLASTGSWTQLRLASGHLATAIAADGADIWTLADGAADSLVERHGAPGSAATASLPLALGAQGLWLSEKGENLVAQLDSALPNASMLPIARNLSGASAPGFADAGCASGRSERSYGFLPGGQRVGVTRCPAIPSRSYWTYYELDAAPRVRSFYVINGDDSDNVAQVRILGDGTFFALNGYQSQYENPSTTYPPVGQGGGVGLVSAIPNAASFGVARIFANSGSSASSDSRLFYDGAMTNDYTLHATPFVPTEMKANLDYVAFRSPAGFALATTAQGATANLIGDPGAASGATVVQFVLATGSYGGQPKARVGVVYSDGSAWLYDQP